MNREAGAPSVRGERESITSLWASSGRLCIGYEPCRKGSIREKIAESILSDGRLDEGSKAEEN
jgi:hypothetical protein